MVCWGWKLENGGFRRKYQEISEDRSIDNVGAFCWEGEQKNGMIGLFPGGSMVKNMPAMQEMWVWSLGQDDPLKKETATLSSILAWKIPWTEEPGGLQSTVLQKSQSDTT